ncbi:MAG: RNA-binding protein [Salinivirgaceae bacterium]|jgi:RNA recognition motif-containing protein|nr:RNA-binding protein [Salinivirgaceae bacterium]
MNIYVGNLNYKVEEESLKKVFSEYGTVESVKLIQDKMSGRSKGFGFVEMLDDTQGQQAIDSLNGSEYLDRKMVVNVARARD